MIRKDIRKLYELIVALHEGEMNAEQFSTLNTMLKQKHLAQHYVEFISIFSELSCPGSVDRCSNDENHDYFPMEDDRGTYIDIMKKFAEEEKRAPAIKIRRDDNELIQKVVRKKVTYQFNRQSLITAIMSVAAIVLVILFARFAPVRGGIEVATLRDSINAKWANPDQSVQTGERLVTGDDCLVLRKGYVELLFDNDAMVTLEAPAEFQILSSDQIKLLYGRLYATVPQQAIGFTVNTPSARIIDLGTEFGINAGVHGDMSLHVMKGKTVLIAGQKNNKISMQVNTGLAKKVAASSQKISNIPCDGRMFVRDIDSTRSLVWRGEAISLANIVAGGNGFTGGNMQSGVDPARGAVNNPVIQEFNRLGDQSYNVVAGRKFVDGVFVPNGAHGANTVTSAGHTFDEFPVTDSYYWSDITSKPTVIRTDQGRRNRNSVSISLEDKDGMVKSESILFLHPNAGITFDLQEIRKSYPDIKMTGFSALCGVPSDVAAHKSAFWVLVDGRCVFHYDRTGDQDQSKKINIPLTSEDHFLTLAATDGGDEIVLDWCVFANPNIEFEVLPLRR